MQRLGGSAPVIVAAVIAGLAGASLGSVGLRAGQAPGDAAARMRAHYGRALDLHAAVIRGDLPAIAVPAAWLAANAGLSSVPAGGQPYVAAIRAGARQAGAAKDVSSAAVATSTLLAACGNCHRTVGVMPAPPSVRPSAPVGGIVGHMLQHQQAAEQMLQGLVVPSTSLWQQGARAFMQSPLHPTDLPIDTPARKEMVAGEERLHRTAGEAVDATDQDSRARLYGLILATCADCHRQHPTVWGPRRGGGG